MDNLPHEWPVIYLTYEDLKIAPQYEGLPNNNSCSIGKYPTITFNSIHSHAKFKTLTKYMTPIEVNGEKLYFGFQCRVHPEYLQYSDKNPHVYFIDRKYSNMIRPYGILLAKAKA